jgi:hypothetical protein
MLDRQTLRERQTAMRKRIQPTPVSQGSLSDAPAPPSESEIARQAALEASI